jgi:hypothetical protein
MSSLERLDTGSAAANYPSVEAFFQLGATLLVELYNSDFVFFSNQAAGHQVGHIPASKDKYSHLKAAKDIANFLQSKVSLLLLVFYIFG